MRSVAIISLEGTGGGGPLCRILEIFQIHSREYGRLLKLEEEFLVIMHLLHRDRETIFSVIDSDAELQEVVAHIEARPTEAGCHDDDE
jgi:hypothetical protein